MHTKIRHLSLSILLCLFGTTISSSLFAKTIADVEVPETVTMAESNETLILNGAGIRSKFFIKVYVCALYLGSKQTEVNDALALPGSKRILMHFLYKEVSKEKLVSAWNDGFFDNSGAEIFNKLKPRLEKFNAMFDTVKRGDVIRLDYIPDQGTKVYIKGQLKGTIEGEDFHKALLLVWLGEFPPDYGLKDDLLGG